MTVETGLPNPEKLLESMVEKGSDEAKFVGFFREITTGEYEVKPYGIGDQFLGYRVMRKALIDLSEESPSISITKSWGGLSIDFEIDSNSSSLRVWLLKSADGPRLSLEASRIDIDMNTKVGSWKIAKLHELSQLYPSQ